MAAINPYLNFNGNTEEAFNFYKSVFGGEFITLQRYKETPHAGEMATSEQEKIMHVALPMGSGNILMGTDIPESMEKVSFGTNFSLSIEAESEAHANEVFSKLSDGGQVTMPLDKTFWGAYFGMLTDKFGVQWMVNYSYGQPQ
jgi:PhnB protein